MGLAAKFTPLAFACSRRAAVRSTISDFAHQPGTYGVRKMHQALRLPADGAEAGTWSLDRSRLGGSSLFRVDGEGGCPVTYMSQLASPSCCGRWAASMPFVMCFGLRGQDTPKPDGRRQGETG